MCNADQVPVKVKRLVGIFLFLTGSFKRSRDRMLILFIISCMNSYTLFLMTCLFSIVVVISAYPILLIKKTKTVQGPHDTVLSPYHTKGLVQICITVCCKVFSFLLVIILQDQNVLGTHAFETVNCKNLHLQLFFKIFY